jgi:type II secretory pathway pseudopilin PulG
MIAVRPRSRPAFTLIELIVAMSVIILLASLALMVVPEIMSQDRTTEGAARLQQYLMIAKARAGRDQAPRGLKLINNGGFATEVQYIEAPPLYVAPDPTSPTTSLQYNLNNAPRVEFTMNVTSSTWTITMANLPDPSVLTNNAIVIVPNLGTWFSIQSISGTGPWTITPNPQSVTGVAPNPDIGAGTQIESYSFGIYGTPQPLLGEPVLQLPSNIGVDLASSAPSMSASTDLVFTPSGDLLTSASGLSMSGGEQVFLWVRDRTKNGGSSGSMSAGGEQQVVGLKTRSGAMGVYPISWTAGNPFEFAKK